MMWHHVFHFGKNRVPLFQVLKPLRPPKNAKNCRRWVKASLVRISAELKGKCLDARIVACIHDSIWVESSLREETDVLEIMERVMTTAISLSVPLSVDFEE